MSSLTPIIALSSLFGGGSVGSPVDLLGLVNAGGAVFGGLFAEGGPIRRGQLGIVGERGPELFLPDVSGRIIDADRTAHLLAGLHDPKVPNLSQMPGVIVTNVGGDTVVETHVTVAPPPGTDMRDAAAAESWGAAIGRVVEAKIVEVLAKQRRPGNLLNPGVYSTLG